MRLDPWNYPVLTVNQVTRIAENMIPENLRQYYVGIDVLKQDSFSDLTAWNTDIELYFKSPVVSTSVDGVRYAHASLEDMDEELRCLEIRDDSSGDDEFSEYDEGIEGRSVVRIRKLNKTIEWKCKAK